LNGGYNPFVPHGKGGLGYRPMRQMIGGMIRDDEDEGGGGGGGPAQLVPHPNQALIDENQNLINEMKLNNDNVRDYITESQRLNQIENELMDDMFRSFEPIIQSKKEEKELQKKIKEKENQKKEIENQIKKGDKLISKIELKISNDYNSMISSINDEISDINNKDLGDNYKRKLLTEVYIKSIESIDKFINDNQISPSIDKNANAQIIDLFSKLNDPTNYSDGRTYKLNEGKVVKEDKPKKESILPFTKNIKSQTELKGIIKKYWDENEKIKLKPDDSYGEDINDMIDEINESIKTNLLDTPIDETSEIYKKLKVIEFPNKTLSESYAKTIKNNGVSKYLNKYGKLGNLFQHDYNASGKAQEFSICGKNNEIAKKLYNVKHPDIMITDFMVNNILGGEVGSQFCCDCIDIPNRKIIEMKKYDGINYIEYYNLQIQLKKTYINDLKIELDKFIDQYLDTPKENKSLRKAYLTNITAIYNVLTNKDEFDKDFYKNKRYYGIGITMNKFNRIEIPSDYVYDDKFNTKEMMEHVQMSQGQKFIPHFVNKQITKITRKPTKDTSKDNKFNKEFNEIIKGDVKPYNFNITNVFSNILGVYDYTNDNLVENDFILGTYRCAYAYDDRDDLHYNAVLIPIEKFIMMLNYYNQ
jgi:hypothetical protein